ncbi:hypothetical protein [Methylacidimicrobium tartarophylax]|uniref:Uncharacterized protein n=1 Tax=Methylacidimicrobium tartarophylax TaxID=1041768 RepID=A0A5E6MLF8_9BACT|nr:hypothetical protein [Methylacidimicrobium tartarophylax]VVM06264.1 hypothetical protein MAMT_01088 [Methylacidimicrobium tartarophylax]
MGWTIDLLSFSSRALAELAGKEPAAMAGTLGLALGCAALSWILLSHSALLWNRGFAPRAGRHPLCALTALATLFAVPLFVGAAHTRPLVHRAIANWARKALEGSSWQEAAFDRARERIRLRRLEPLLPSSEAHFLPLTTAAAREAAATSYAAAALASFSTSCPQVAALLGICPAEPAHALSADMKAFFDSSTGFYPAERIETVLADSLRQAADQRWEDTVRRMQIFLLLLLLLLHLTVFGILGWAGYREIRTGWDETNR